MGRQIQFKLCKFRKKSTVGGIATCEHFHPKEKRFETMMNLVLGNMNEIARCLEMNPNHFPFLWTIDLVQKSKCDEFAVVEFNASCVGISSLLPLWYGKKLDDENIAKSTEIIQKIVTYCKSYTSATGIKGGSK